MLLLSKEIENEAALADLRKEYIVAPKSKKSQLTSQIHQKEEELYSFYRQILLVEKKYRSLEAE